VVDCERQQGLYMMAFRGLRAGGHRVAGHFGELMQGRLGPEGPLALISLPCPDLTVTARQQPAASLRLYSGGLLSAQRARAFLHRLGMPLRAAVQLHASMPIGGGAGSSTAALVALARLAGWCGDPERLADACLWSEGATDPLMFPHPERMLWASRQARVLGQLPRLPRFDVVGGFFGQGARTHAGDLRFPDIADLVDQWHGAARAGDLAALAGLCTQSAQRCLALRHEGADPIVALAESTGALGYLIAHTGAARGLIFAPQTVPEGAQAALRAAGLRGVLHFRAGGEGA
jgi:uncharacterized protein involved in propanediol utilization